MASSPLHHARSGSDILALAGSGLSLELDCVSALSINLFYLYPSFPVVYMPTASEVPVVKGEPVPMESLHVSNEVQSVSSSTPAASDTSRSLMDAWSSQELHDVFNGDGDEMIVVHNTFIEWCKMAEVNQYNILHQNGGSIHPDRFTSAPAIFGTSSFLPAASPLREVPSTVPEVASPPTQPLPSPPVSATTVMVRNIPTRISSKTFIEVVLSYAPAATLVDFLYLPIDFKTNKNLGYCFINFVSEDKAAEFTAKYNDRKYVF